MSAPHAADSISDQELLFRRIPEATQWYRPDTGFIDPAAFTPNKNDITGLSLGRAAFQSTAQEAAKGRAGKTYYVAVLPVAVAKDAGAIIVPRPLANDPGHAEIVNLTFQRRKTDDSRKLIEVLRAAVIRVEGPFDGQAVVP
jgi:hypothetical protein